MATTYSKNQICTISLNILNEPHADVKSCAKESFEVYLAFSMLDNAKTKVAMVESYDKDREVLKNIFAELAFKRATSSCAT